MKYKKWTLKEKLEILSTSEEIGVVETCRKYSVSTGTFYSWKKKFEHKGEKGLKVTYETKSKELKDKLTTLFQIEKINKDFDIYTSKVVRTERSIKTSPQSIVNLFQRWYRDMNFIGCSSHSGRRTFITNLSKKLSIVGGTLRDVQGLVGHKNLQTTQRYIEIDTDCQRQLVNLI